MATTIFYAIIIILVFSFLLERVLDYLNSTLWSNDLPKELEDIYDAEKYKKSQNYEKAKHNFGWFTDTFSLVLILAMLFFGGFAIVNTWATHFSQHPIIIALLFFAIIGLASDIINTPLAIYSTFVIEEKFGFNRTKPITFIMDKIKSWILAAIIGGLLLSAMMWFYFYTGKWFWLYAWAFVAAFMILMYMFYSNLIVPLFNKQTPLPEGELRDAIQDFAHKVGFEIDNIYQIDGSKRTAKANAYFTGLGKKKRIVLYDTLIKNHKTEELVAVLAHEIGHYKLKHTLKGLILGILETGIMLFVLSLCINNPDFSKALGVAEPVFHIGIITFGLLYSPISLLLGIFGNLLSRKHEFQADKFAGQNYDAQALQTALKKLSVDNLSNLRPHPWYVLFYYSHPPLLARLKALSKIF